VTAPDSSADPRPPADAPSEPRGCLPTFLVLAVMFAIPLSASLSLALAESAPLVPVQVSERVTIIPASGWEVGQIEGGAGVYVTSGSGTLVVRDVPGGSSAAGVLRETLDAWTNDPQIGIVVGDETPVDRFEGALGSGDSGGSLWIRTARGWAIAGINVSGDDDQYGASNWYSRVSTQKEWILRVFPGARFAGEQRCGDPASDPTERVTRRCAAPTPPR